MSESPLDHIPGPAIKIIFDSLDVVPQQEYFRQVLQALRNRGLLSLTDDSEFQKLDSDFQNWLRRVQDQCKLAQVEILAAGDRILNFSLVLDNILSGLATTTLRESFATSTFQSLIKLAGEATDVSHKVVLLYQEAQIAELYGAVEAIQRSVISWLEPIAESMAAIRGCLNLVADTLTRLEFMLDMAAHIHAISDILVMPHVDWIDRLEPGFGQNHE